MSRPTIEPEIEEPLRSVEMEMAALGAMLMLDDAAVTAGMQRLHARHFPGSIHQTIFRAICRLSRQRDAGSAPGLLKIDLIAVGEELRRCGELERDVRCSYLAALIQACPCSANLDYYADKVIEWSKRRHLRELAEEINARVLLPDATPDKIANAVRNAANAIAAQGHADIKAIFDKEK